MSERVLDYFEEAPFVLALDASPEDDISRLAYADWLEERGDPRAGYLRAIAALRQAVRERDATPEDWLPVHRHWKGRLDAWQEDVGGRFDVAVTKFQGRDAEREVGWVLQRQAVRNLAASCRRSGWELVSHRLSLYGAAQLGRRLTSAGCTVSLRASRLSYPYDYTRLAFCVANLPPGELLVRPLPQGTLATAASSGSGLERFPAIFSGQHGSAVLADVAGLDLLARTSGYVPDESVLSMVLPPSWRVLDKPAKPKWSAHSIDFYCHDSSRGWTLRCEYRSTGCIVSAVSRT